MKRLNILYFCFVIVMLSPAYVTGQIIEEVAKQAAEATFSAAERELIKKYYEVTGQAEDDDIAENEPNQNKIKNNANNRNNGNRPDLPKGIVKKLERGGTLPPGIAKRPLASDLERQLPEVPDGFERVESEGKVILRNVVSGVITDIIDVVARPGNDSMNESYIEDDRSPENNTNDQQAERKWWQFWK